MNVLLVEDQKALLVFWQMEFGRHLGEFNLRTATTVAEAKEYVEVGEIDVAIVDMGIPFDCNSEDPRHWKENPQYGLWLLRHLSMDLGIPTIALTGSENPEILRKIECPLISKPVENFEKDVFPLLRGFQQSATAGLGQGGGVL